jgi:pilus assembly protein CpaE
VAVIPKVLIVGPDPKLRREFDAALAGITDVGAVVHSVGDYRQGVEAVRSRRPDLALVEMGRDLRPLQSFAEEAASASPETAVAAVFSAEIFGPDVSESAVLIAALRAGVRDFLRRPLSSADLEQLLGRMARPVVTGPAHHGAVVSFLSNKGGVGKSTLAVNVACLLARRHPDRVLLVDASLQMGVCATLLDLRPQTSLTDALRERDRLDETLVRQLATPHESGLHLLAAPADAVEAAAIDDEVMARVLTLARRAYDVVIVDSFPLVDRVMMAVLDLSDRDYLVLEGVVPTVLGAVKLVRLLETLGIPADRQRLVLNRHSRFAGNLPPADVAQRLGRPVDFVVPYQKQLLIAANLGRPYVLQASRLFSRFPPAVERLARDVEGVKPRRESARVEGGLQAPRNGAADGKGRKAAAGELPDGVEAESR